MTAVTVSASTPTMVSSVGGGICGGAGGGGGGLLSQGGSRPGTPQRRLTNESGGAGPSLAVSASTPILGNVSTIRYNHNTLLR